MKLGDTLYYKSIGLWVINISYLKGLYLACYDIRFFDGGGI